MTQRDDVVVCSPLRTPIGRYGGVFRGLAAADLGSHLLAALVERTSLDPELIDDVVLGHCNASSEAPSIGRVVALDAGLPVSVPGRHLDRRCGSGLQAVLDAASSVASGAAEVVVAGGTESMSNAVFYSTDVRWGAARTGMTMHDGLVRARATAGGRHHPVPGGMIETAENLRRDLAISREDQDALAVESHRRAVAAQTSGVWSDEIVPVPVRSRSGTQVVDTDEHPRAGTTMESLSVLKPLMAGTIEGATVTAGNASGQNDAAAMCIVTTAARADELGLDPLLALRSWAVAGVEPSRMGIGPVPATEKALARAGLALADIDVVELNEAFAAQALAVLRTWGFGPQDMERTNVHGSGISLGHPVGATGARMVGTLAHELRRRGGGKGLVTMCIGGGQGLAAIFEGVRA